MIYTVTLNPALDKTVRIPGMTVDAVNRITELRTDPGGKGINVSKVIAKLGGQSVAVALLAGSTGQTIADAVAQLGIACDLTFTQGQTRTNLKIVDPVNHTNTDINEPGITVTPALLEDMLEKLLAKLRPGDIVVLSGSLPRGAGQDTYFHWVSRCKQTGARVFLDADGQLLAQGLKAAPYLVKPNNHELSRLVGRPLESAEEITQAAQQLLKLGVQKVVVSMGGQGALYVTAQGIIRAQGLRVPVGSTVGAGDSVVAALAYAEEQGMSPEEAVRLSTATGAANVMCSGSQAAEWETIEALMPQVQMVSI